MFLILLAAQPAKFVFTLVAGDMHATPVPAYGNLALRTVIRDIFLV